MHGQELPGVYVLEWNSTLREYISGTHQRTTAAKTCADYLLFQHVETAN